MAKERDAEGYNGEAISIRGFLPVSLNEWKDRVCAVIFTPRCNWRCPYCHGWRFVCEHPDLPEVAVETVFAHLDKQSDWLDGVVVSGGEPTLQPGLAPFLQAVKERGLAVKLETNGSRPDVITALLAARLIDCLCLDYKAPLDERLLRIIGVAETTGAAELAAVKRSFALAAASGVEREYHTTLCPAFVDASAIAAMGMALEPDGLWVLQQYEPADCLSPAAGDRQYTAAEIAELARIAQHYHRRVLVYPGRGHPKKRAAAEER